jgi:hypothetical protein
MFRRKRRTREIPFSFDSFLDVVANVVGIIIRLILIVWVGARSYSTIKPVLAPAAKPGMQAPGETPLPADPLQAELERGRRELEALQARMLEQLRDLQTTDAQAKLTEGEVEAVLARGRGLDDEVTGVERAVLDKKKLSQGDGVTLAALEQRRQKLTQEILAIEKQPPPQKVLRYRTPVSELVKTDEFFFECKGGRVTFIDIGSLKAMAEADITSRVQELRTNRFLEGTTTSEGAFRIRYSLRFLGGDEGLRADVRSALSVEPTQPVRGESADVALAPGSQFRQVVDRLDPRLAAVTCWIYPDSFAAFRRVRDYLYERDIVVAGRALPEGVFVTLSSHGGSASRGL